MGNEHPGVACATRLSCLNVQIYCVCVGDGCSPCEVCARHVKCEGLGSTNEGES
jgi:hypothetical protein